METTLLILLPVLTLGSAITVDDCPAGLDRDKNLHVLGHFCFRFEMIHGMSWGDALEVCRREGGVLAMPKNFWINKFIVNITQNHYRFDGKVHIGLNDIKKENSFTWVDGSPWMNGPFWDYENWAPGEGPSSNWIAFPVRNHLNDCVNLDTTNGEWSDEDCTDISSFVCQYNKTEPRPTQPPTRPPSTNESPAKVTTNINTDSRTRMSTRPTTSISTDPTTAQPSTSQAPSKVLRPTCPPFVCTLDCGMDGYTLDTMGCSLCKCDTK